ncbi:LacI family DNA-binding transcriptional regulator [Arenivirga flava]|uniref:LacI family transcriptional regulator n=1 Tax=Arenivirga flava TaxID=1930060 RepID=A0AA37XC98_9MICO|nr:LacI family DNA-binding transcriptional regulator [Arenivirga flava]GMA29836.1 LacI family transcriptional regulator [Arenivirga flava]
MAQSKRVPKTPRPSMVDVGNHAGVSAQSVSRYFTGKGYVSDEARERIAEAIAALGYVRNQVARNLRVDRTDTIGVLCLGPLNYGNAEIVSGLSAEAQTAGYSLIITQLELERGDPAGLEQAQHAIDRFLGFQVDGVVLTTPFPGTDLLLDRIAPDLPVVAMAARSEDPKHTVVTTASSYSAGLQATRHLLALGHTRILHLAGPPGRNETYERERGYHDALAEAGVEPLPVLPQRDWSAEGGHDSGASVDPADFTAIFAANDEIALGFMSAMRERGYHAPGDYSIIGVDDMAEAAYFAPPLTTMRLDFRSLGRQTLRMMLSRIRDGEPAHGFVIEAELIQRASTAPPPPSPNS